MVFNHTAYYDTMIANYLRDKAGLPKYPDTISMTFEKVQDMRYGENPHQSAAFYKEVGNSDGMLSGIEQLHGKELSFNNINDLHGALELLKEFDEEPTVVACKHSNLVVLQVVKIFTKHMLEHTIQTQFLFLVVFYVLIEKLIRLQLKKLARFSLKLYLLQILMMMP